MHISTKTWYDHGSKMLTTLLGFILILVFLTVTLVFVWIEAGVTEGLLLGFLLIVLIMSMVVVSYRNYREAHRKMARRLICSPRTAFLVIKKVLDESHIPYHQKQKDGFHFALTEVGEPLYIRIQSFVQRRGPAGVLIIIGPYGNKASDKVMETLMNQFDKAFLAKGLVTS